MHVSHFQPVVEFCRETVDCIFIEYVRQATTSQWIGRKAPRSVTMAWKHRRPCCEMPSAMKDQRCLQALWRLCLHLNKIMVWNTPSNFFVTLHPITLLRCVLSFGMYGKLVQVGWNFTKCCVGILKIRLEYNGAPAGCHTALSIFIKLNWTFHPARPSPHALVRD